MRLPLRHIFQVKSPDITLDKTHGCDFHVTTHNFWNSSCVRFKLKIMKCMLDVVTHYRNNQVEGFQTNTETCNCRSINKKMLQGGKESQITNAFRLRQSRASTTKMSSRDLRDRQQRSRGSRIDNKDLAGGMDKMEPWKSGAHVKPRAWRSGMIKE